MLVIVIIGIVVLIGAGARFGASRWFESANRQSHPRTANGVMIGAEPNSVVLTLTRIEANTLLEALEDRWHGHWKGTVVARVASKLAKAGAVVLVANGRSP